MGFSEAMAVGMMIPVGLGVAVYAVNKAYFAFQREPQTTSEKATAVYWRLYEGFQRDNHHNPQKAARDQIWLHQIIDEFRQFTCLEYLNSNRTLDESREDWWKERQPIIKRVAQIDAPPADAALLLRILKSAVFADSEDETYIYEPALTKWTEEKKRREVEFQSTIRQLDRPDASTAHVIEAMYAAGDGVYSRIRQQ